MKTMKNHAELQRLIELGDVPPCPSAPEDNGTINLKINNPHYDSGLQALSVDWVIETIDEDKMVYTTFYGFNIPGLTRYGAHYTVVNYGSRQKLFHGNMQVIVNEIPAAGTTVFFLCVICDLNLSNEVYCRTEVPITFV